MVDCHQKLVFIDLEFLSQKIPRVKNRFFFKIIAERKIAQHLEERVVARCEADIVEVIVLSARPHAFLRSSRALEFWRFYASEIIFKLIHSSVGEHQSRIVVWNQRAGGNDLVAVVCEVVEKFCADFVGRKHQEDGGVLIISPSAG